jgi:hypothetical protein
MPTTPRYGLNTPTAVDPDNVPQWMHDLAFQLDNSMMGFTQGTFAARPAPGGVGGKLYFATDTLVLYQTDSAGLNWRAVAQSPTVPAARFYNATQQIVIYHTGDANPVPPWWTLLAWDTVDWRINGFAGVGPAVVLPVPGVYRISGQVTFEHILSARMTQENYNVWINRDGIADADIGHTDAEVGHSVGLLSIDQTTDEYLGASLTSPQLVGVRFDTIAEFDLTSQKQSGFKVFGGSSNIQAPGGGGFVFGQRIFPGSQYTFLEIELLNAY